MDLTGSRVHLEKNKSAKWILTVIIITVAFFLSYQLGKNVGEFLYYIMH